MKTKILLGAAFVALAATAPAVLQAQQLPAPVIAVVNTDQIFSTCTQCTAATAQLQTQATALQARVTQLQTEIQAENNALEPLVRALNGAQPDAALTTRIQNFETRRQNADREVTQSRQRIERNLQFVRQQIGERTRPAIQTVQQQRGASIVMDASQVLVSAPTLDITPAVLAIVNQNNTPLNVNAPPPPASPAPAGARPPATPAPAQPNRPRPQGR